MKETINFLNDLLKDTEDEILKQTIRDQITIILDELKHSVLPTKSLISKDIKRNDVKKFEDSEL